MKARLKNDGSSIQNEADNQINSVLESQTPDATNIEEGQVNGLLEILDSRPDVQDIIRRGMSMDFADDNAKILYVGHLIDHALTRPDVLALYYASSHGRNNNVRIKTEVHKQQQQQQHNHNNHNNHHNCCDSDHHEHDHHHGMDDNHNDHIDDDAIEMNGSNGSHSKKEKRSKSRKHKRKKSVIEVKREAVPQPATISLSNGGNVGFVNSANVNTFPPPTTSGVPLINFGGSLPPIHLPFPLVARGIGKIPPHTIPLTMSSVIGRNGNDGDRSDEQSASSFVDTDSNHNQNNNQQQQNGGLFPMNVTPSVSMMGGPPLASM